MTQDQSSEPTICETRASLAECREERDHFALNYKAAYEALSKANEEAAQYRKRYKTEQVNFNGLNHTYNTLMEEADELRKSCAQLRRAYDTLQAQCKQQYEDFDNLNSSYDALRSEYNTLKLAYDSINDNRTHLQREYASALGERNEEIIRNEELTRQNEELIKRNKEIIRNEGLIKRGKECTKDRKPEALRKWNIDITCGRPGAPYTDDIGWAQERRYCCCVEKDVDACCKPELTNPEPYHKCKCSGEDRIVAGCSRGVAYECRNEAPKPLPPIERDTNGIHI
ncbi:MAG: hypothetical protein RR182_00765 [Alistipes sp.]